jgi:hypothetical protein
MDENLKCNLLVSVLIKYKTIAWTKQNFEFQKYIR